MFKQLFDYEKNLILSIMNVFFITLVLIASFIIITEFDEVTLITGGFALILFLSAIYYANTRLKAVFTNEKTIAHRIVNVLVYSWLIFAISEAFTNMVYFSLGIVDEYYANPGIESVIWLVQIPVAGIVLYIFNKYNIFGVVSPENNSGKVEYGYRFCPMCGADIYGAYCIGCGYRHKTVQDTGLNVNPENFENLDQSADGS